MLTRNFVGAVGMVVGEIIISQICLGSQPGFGYGDNIHPICLGFIVPTTCSLGSKHWCIGPSLPCQSGRSVVSGGGT